MKIKFQKGTMGMRALKAVDGLRSVDEVMHTLEVGLLRSIL